MNSYEPGSNNADSQAAPDETVEHRPAPPVEHEPDQPDQHERDRAQPDQRPAPSQDRPAPPQAAEPKPPPPDQAAMSRPAPPQQQPVTSQPPPPQPQPVTTQPPPPQQQAPGYQYQQQPQYPQQLGYQQPSYQQPGYQQPGYQQPGSQTSPQRSRLPIVVAAIALLIPVGVGGWYAFGRNDDAPAIADEPDDPKTTKPSATEDPDEPAPDEPDTPGTTEPDAPTTEPATTAPQTTEPVPTEPTPDDYPTNPQLKQSISVNMDPDETWIRVAYEGTADDLYIGEQGVGTSTVTRYVNGQPKWEARVGLGGTAFLSREGGYLLFSSSTPDYSGDSIVRLDPETGATIWEITSKKNLWYRFLDGRMFVVEEGDGQAPGANISEYDPETGSQIRTVGGSYFEITDNQIWLIDAATSSVQPLNLELQPDGGPITLEPSNVDYLRPVVVTRYEGGWLYYTNRTSSGGQPTIVGLSPNGDKQFECATKLEEAFTVELRDDSTLVVGHWSAIEVFDFDGSTCTSRWSHETDGNDDIDTYGSYPEVRRHNWGPDDSLIDIELDVLDWRNGGVITTGKDVAYINDDDQMITFQGDQLVSKGLRNDDVQWSIDAPGDTGVSLGPGMVVIVTKTGGGATVGIYSD